MLCLRRWPIAEFLNKICQLQPSGSHIKQSQFALGLTAQLAPSAASKADIASIKPDVRFTPESGHRRARPGCRLCAKNRRRALFGQWSKGADRRP